MMRMRRKRAYTFCDDADVEQQRVGTCCADVDGGHDDSAEMMIVMLRYGTCYGDTADVCDES